MCLSKKAVLISLSLSAWKGTKIDRSASADVCKSKGAEDGSARVYKSLVDRKSLSGITTIQTKARTLVYNKTLPWLDNGVRVLPNALYMDFMTDLGQLERDHDKAVSDFLNSYNEQLLDAQNRLGDLFNIADFPTVDQLRSKFKMCISVMPFPEAEDFRVESVNVDDLKSQFEKQSSERIANMVKDMADRCVDLADEFTAKVSSGKRFWDSLPEKLADLGKTLDGLNITKDAKIAQASAKLLKIGSYTADQIRSSESVKAEVTQEAKDIKSVVSDLASIF